MSADLNRMLEFAQGPLFRFAFALMVLGCLRALLLGASDALGAYLVTRDHSQFWRKLRMRVLWFTFPSVLLHRVHPEVGPAMRAYHFCLFTLSLVFRITVIIVPAFMVAHVYLWDPGVWWPTLASRTADVLSLVAIVAGLLLFFGRLYTPLLRRLEAPWSFLKPLLLVIPFATGMLSMRPSWSPLDYQVVLLVHAYSAALVFVLIPFGRMLSCMHTPLTHLMPEASWQVPTESSALAGAAVARE